MNRILFGLVVCLAAGNSSLLADELVRTVPDEFESIGGNGLALGNAGVAAAQGSATVLANPALLPLETVYQIDLGYHWPTAGRKYMQGGVVDSKTARLAAGLSFTGFSEKAQDRAYGATDDGKVNKRLSLGLGGVARWIALGATAQYVEGLKRSNDPGRFLGWEKSSHVTFGAGLAGSVLPGLKLGASVMNLRNEEARDFAPRTIRAGGALALWGDLVTVGLEGVERERIPAIEGAFPELDIGLRASGAGTGLTLQDNATAVDLEKPERMVIGSLSARIYSLLKMSLAYGASVVKDDPRRSLSGGLGLEQNHFGISYMVSRPYLERSEIHSAVNLNFQAAL